MQGTRCYRYTLLKATAAIVSGLILCVGNARVGQADNVQASASNRSPEETAGWLGVELKGIWPQDVKTLGLPHPEAVMVVIPVPGSPADRAGLLTADIIIELEGIPVKSQPQFTDALRRRGAGRTVTLKVWRKGVTMDIKVTLGSLANAQLLARNRSLGEYQDRWIQAMESILVFFNRDVFPLDWGTT